MEFYGKLFAWTFKALPGCEHLAAEIVSDGTPIGTLRVAEGNISAFNGVVYVKVEDLQASCKRAEELGGKIPEGFPFNLPDGGGSVALVTDPSNHSVGMFCTNPVA
jgi:predicted enzyme related to lactoylglutathione lyase